MRLTKPLACIAAFVVAFQGISFTSKNHVNAVGEDYGAVDDKILSGATYTITNILSSRQVTADEDGNVCQREAVDGLSQQWKIIALSDGYCKIVSNSNTDLALTVEDVNTPNGSNIRVDLFTGVDSQLFKINWDGSAYFITTKCSNNVSAVDIKGKSKADGANVHQYKYQGNDNQRFEIIPLNNQYSWIKGDLDFDGALTVFDLTLMKRAYLNGADSIETGIADVTADGSFDIEDVRLLQDFLLAKEKHFPEIYYTLPYTTPEIINPDNTDGRLMEYLNRGVYAVSTGKNVFVSWRSLATDAPDMAFNVYRTTDGKTTKLNDVPLTGGTNFTDTTADLKKDNTYFVKSVVNGVEVDTDGVYTLGKNAVAQVQTIDIKPGSEIHFVWVGDFNGDGAYDFLVDRCTDNHQKLEAYLNDGTYLWTIDLGVNSENKNNISPGASTIDVGMWDGVTVYDMDCDGYADVLVRIADGVTFGDGKMYKNSITNGQAIAVIDGRTGALKAEAAVPDDYINIGPMACMMEIGYVNGKTPSVICWMKNRNKDKSFNSITAAYGYTDGKFGMQWKFDNTKTAYAEAHQIRVADVDYDGKDEVLHMGYALNSDGTLRYHNDEVVHGDRWYVGAFSNANNGNAMMEYGIQQENGSGLLEYFYNASTGKMIWTNYADKGTYDVARGNIGDIDPNYDGFECWSFQGTFNQDGTKITDSYLYPVIRLWWDSDLLSESYNDGKIEKWNYKNKQTDRVATTWKMTDCTGSNRGAPMFYGDILGDWREEIIMTSSDYSKLVILSTADETDTRLYSLAQNPCYRNCMTGKGYYQSHMLDYFLGYDMEMPKTPDITIINKK